MEEVRNSSSLTSMTRSVHDYHRGNGTLRGGGIQKVYNNGPTFKGYKRKLDYRLGYCIIGCLITIATVLIIFGLFHEIAHQELTRYIESTRKMIADSLNAATTIATTTTVISTAVAIAPTITFSDEQDIYLDDEQYGTFKNGSNISKTVMTVKHLADGGRIIDGQHDDKTQEMLHFPYSEPDTCLGSVNVDETKCLLLTELDEYYDLLHRSHIALWNLATLNIVVAVLMMPLTILFIFQVVKSGHYKLFYRVVLFLVLLFMAAQLIILISSLLYSSYMYPIIVDRLFIEKLPRDTRLISRVESRFACQFDYITQLVELSIQEPCISRIKNSLLLPYAVVLLIIIDLIPFAFIFFTYAWDKWLKDSSICVSARTRIEMNNQRRPQSREDILKKVMEEPRYV